MEHSDIQSTIEWLLSGARSASKSQDVLAELCDRITACRVPLSRVEIFVRTLHPDRVGRRFEWSYGTGVSVSLIPFAGVDAGPAGEGTPMWELANSPVLEGRLHSPGCPAHSPTIRNILAGGATDIFATPLVSTSGEVHSAIWATSREGGFSASDISILQSVVYPLSRVAEVRGLRQTAINLLDTYVGNHAGGRILGGQIRRGHVEAINAAIWLSDMRGFTSLSDRLPPRTIIDLLNSYFGCQEPAILQYGGQVLKFMGDGMLAMFPINSEADIVAVCASALAAAKEARSNVAELNSKPASGFPGAIRFGLALHFGEVLYGNIGGNSRLDFTCIGPAVNLAARIEKLSARLGRTILTSGQFAARCPSDLTLVGEFPLAGFDVPQKVFGPPDETTN